jgi:hypothetical protein
MGSLPHEVWGIIIDNFVNFDPMMKERYDSLLALALVSRTIGAIATSRLYSCVDRYALRPTLEGRRDLAACVKWMDVSLRPSTKAVEKNWTWQQVRRTLTLDRAMSLILRSVRNTSHQPSQP